MVEGRSGLLHVAADWITDWSPSLRRLKFRTGAEATLFSGHSPEILRGPEHDIAWCDELAKWEEAQATWDMLQLGLRLGEWPRAPRHHHPASRRGPESDHGGRGNDRHRRSHPPKPARLRRLARRRLRPLRRHPPRPPGARSRAPPRRAGCVVDGGAAGEMPGRCGRHRAKALPLEGGGFGWGWSLRKRTGGLARHPSLDPSPSRGGKTSTDPAR